MWQGILAGYEAAEASRERQLDRDFRARQLEASETRAEEQMRLEREKFNLLRQEKLLAMLPQLRSNSAPAAAIAGQANRLRSYLDDDEELISTIVGTGNPEAISSILSNIETGFVKAEEEGRGDAYLQTVRSTLRNDYSFDPATESEIDQDLINKIFGDINLADMGIDTTFTVPGGYVGRPVVYQQTATLEDLNSVERRIGNFAVDQGNREVARIRRGVTQITEMLSDPSLDPTVAANLRSDLIALTDRRMLVDAALDDAKGDNASFGSVLNLYGNDAADRALTSGPRSVDPSSLSPTFTDLISRQPITVVSPEQAQRFFELGVITESDSIIYNGRQYPVRDLFEG
jgi:hypothetical protein